MAKRRNDALKIGRAVKRLGSMDDKTLPRPAKRSHKLMSESCSFSLAEQVLSEISSAYAKAGNRKDAVAMKKYMRDQFEFYGIKSPARRAIDRKIYEQHFPLDVDALRCLLNLCWQKDQREFQYFACDVAKEHKSTLCGQSSESCLESLHSIEKLITAKSWWDTVDSLASNVIGHFAQVHSSDVIPVLDTWIKSDCMWLRRTAIIHQLSFKDHTDGKILFKYCDLCSHEREFFIEKAIGWALRQYHQINPKEVEAYVKKNKDKLAKLSVREALKHSSSR